LSINPYVAGQINVKDSSSFIPALMLPGNAGITINSRFEFPIGIGTIAFAPINFAVKFISNFADSNVVLVQHNLRSAIQYKYSDYFIISVQYTYGWHNSTSQSTNYFKKFFNKNATDIQYLLISLQTKLNSPTASENTKPTYLFVEWRSLLNIKSWNDLPNQRIFSIGLRKEFSFDYGTPGKGAHKPNLDLK